MVRKLHFGLYTVLLVPLLLTLIYRMPLITNQLAHHHFRHSFRPVFPVPPVENLTDRTGGLAAFVVIPARPPYRTVAGDARIATPGASVRVRMLSHHRGGKRRVLWR